MSSAEIVIHGARQHNLKGFDLSIPRGTLTVISGPSGSGKSSLAFDTIYAEAQRRYVESLQTFARQFMELLAKPEVDSIDGLPPAIAVRQEAPARNPRSTVGTVTEIHDFLRVLYARVGEPHCPICGERIEAHTVARIVDAIAAREGARIILQAPVASGIRSDWEALFAQLRKDGFVRVSLDGVARDLGEAIAVDVRVAHDLEVQVDRLIVKTGIRERLTDSVELALRAGAGLIRIVDGEGRSELKSERYLCPTHRVALPPITPRSFSWNSVEGACPTCEGLGELERFDPDLIVPDRTISIAAGAISPWGAPGQRAYKERIKALERGTSADPEIAFGSLSDVDRIAVFFGAPASTGKKGRFEGVIPLLEKQWNELHARLEDDDEGLEGLLDELARYRSTGPCPSCRGSRLRSEVLAVTVDGLSIHEFESLSVDEAALRFDRIEFDPRRAAISEPLRREIRTRLGFLRDVGVGYLSLDRRAGTLSTGEAQRIRLATRIGHALVGVLYVLDEPSIGLHPRDIARLVATLRGLRDGGSTVLVVEHDLEIVRAADLVIDIGPGAGILGGQVIARGTPAEIEQDPASITGAFLSGRRQLARAKPRRSSAPEWIRIRDAHLHNLKHIAVDIPVAAMTAITGVSGAGKSALAVGTLLVEARAVVNRRPRGAIRASIEGLEAFDRVIAFDDRPIGRSARSTPATYAGILGPIRELFASLPDSRARGWDVARFSFNARGGRCENCRGEGVVRVSMHFLPDVLTTCDVCDGKRFDRETLEPRWRGSSIADVLAMTVDQARDLFGGIPQLREKLDTMSSVGLGYLQLGQSATTLSGGEAQRLALSKELSRRATGRTLYVLDEPTTGLHLSDVEVVLGVLHELVEQGNTVVLIEHAVEIVRSADWVIDLGPEGGPGGGEVVAFGTPEAITKEPRSHTGGYLARELAPGERTPLAR